MILITGATGQFGKTTIDFLLAKGLEPSNIAAMVREPEKAEDLKQKGVEIRVGNYDDTDSLLAATKGIEKILLISSPTLDNRGQQHENVINAAKANNVKHIVYTSFERKNDTDSSPIAYVASSHLQTEGALKQSGMDYTIMRNSLYADILPMFLGEKVTETGVYFPIGEGRAAYTLREDMAEAAANILATTGHENKEYTIAADTNYSIQDIATALSQASGTEVTYNSPDKDEYTNTLANAGVPAEYIGLQTMFADAIKQGEFDTVTTDLPSLLGRKPTSIADYFKTVYSK